MNNIKKEANLKIKKKVTNVFKVIITACLVITFTVSMAACEKPPVVEEIEEAEETIVPETTEPVAEEEIAEEKEEVVEEEIVVVNAPEIKDWKFDQKTRTYTDKEGKVVAVFVENALKNGDNWEDAMGIVPGEIRKILIENAAKGIFKCPWPFDLMENKIEVVELVSIQNSPTGMLYPNPIGMKYSDDSNGVSFYAPFDVSDEFAKDVIENIPQKEGDPDFFSVQAYKAIVLSTDFSYKSEEMDYERGAMIQFIFVDWKPLIELGKPEKLDNDAYIQDIIGKIKAGDLLGELYAPDFLDFGNNPKFYENPGEFQGRLYISDFFDDLPNESCVERVLRLGEMMVFVWPEENTAHEQTN